MRWPCRISQDGPGGFPGLLRLCLVAGLLVAGLAGPLAAQQDPRPTAKPVPDRATAPAALPVLTLDFERLIDESRWGKRIAADLARESAALNSENNRIAEDLIAEEKALTGRRASLPPAAFRTEAEAFDDRATGIRNAQNAKAQALSRSFEAARQEFYAAMAPLLDEVLAGRGAVVVLDRRVIIRGLEAADITDDLVHLVDARLGEGPPAPTPAPAPATAPTGTGN